MSESESITDENPDIETDTETDTPTVVLSEHVQSPTQIYAQQRPQFLAFESKLREQFFELFAHRHLDMQLESRTKSVESVREKILRQDKSYEDPLKEITDFVGLRLICFYLDDVDRVGDLLREAFEVDWKNSVDRRSLFLDPDRFGYQSVHYVIGLKPKMLEEEAWQPFAEMQAEVQVRTLLQHAWAAIEHRLHYKASQGIPKAVKRQFYRLSALLELADEEFTGIKQQTEKLREQHLMDLSTGNLDIEIDRYSLTEYLRTSPQVGHWIEAARRCEYRVSLQTDYYSSMATTRLLEFLSAAGILMIGELDHILKAVETGGEDFIREFLQQCRKLYGSRMTLNAAPQFLLPHLICYYYRYSQKLNQLVEAEELGGRAEQALKTALKVFQMRGRHAPEL